MAASAMIAIFIRRRYRSIGHAPKVPAPLHRGFERDPVTGEVRSIMIDWVYDDARAPFVVEVRRVPLAVRWTHPSFFGEHVAFVPS
jgi:hypothetical protein